MELEQVFGLSLRDEEEVDKYWEILEDEKYADEFGKSIQKQIDAFWRRQQRGFGGYPIPSAQLLEHAKGITRRTLDFFWRKGDIPKEDLLSFTDYELFGKPIIYVLRQRGLI